MATMQIGLGTAHFGHEYGLAEHQGRTPISEVSRILERGRELGVDLIDTARSYGESEQVLGSLAIGESGYKIVTKVPAIAPGVHARSFVRDCVEESLRDLNADRLYGVLLHRADDCLIDGGVPARALTELRDAGVIERVGLSVYTAVEIERALTVWDFDLIQLPLSVFDQRLLESDIIHHLVDQGVEVHVRSVFLQGALLMTPDRLPDHLSGLGAPLARWRKQLASRGLTPLEGALGFLAARTEVARAIVGVRSVAELEEVWAAVTNPTSDLPYEAFAVHDPAVVDPRQWLA